MEKKNVWTVYDKKMKKEADAFGKAYCKFLDNGKTERECIDQIVNRIENEGYMELSQLVKENKKLQAGDKVYSVCMAFVDIFLKNIDPSHNGIALEGYFIGIDRNNSAASGV